MDDLLLQFAAFCVLMLIAIIAMAIICYRAESKIDAMLTNSESVEELTLKIEQAEQRFNELRAKLEFTTADEYWQVKRDLDELKRRLNAKQNG